MSINITISLIFMFSIIQFPSLKNQSADHNAISDRTPMAMRAQFQFHNDCMYSPIISYNLLISPNESPFRSRDIANVVFLNDVHKLRSVVVSIPTPFSL
jgi:hypothetical protein